MAVRLGAACFRVRVTFSPVFSVLSRFTSVYQYPVAAKKSARSTSVSASSLFELETQMLSPIVPFPVGRVRLA